VEARRVAAYAIRSDSAAWEKQVRELKRLLPRLITTGALTTQAYVLNGIALLSRRLGRFQEALHFSCEAVPLAIFSGDLALIQSVLFNAGNIISELRRTDPQQMALVDPLALIEMDIMIRRQFGLGRDSAQAELLLAFLAFENNDVERAEHWLEEAQGIIETTKILPDQALFYRIRGLVALSRQAKDQSGLADLARAILLFQEIGNQASAEWVQQERARHLSDTGP
jgi:tetratricopeptide (TPR) repeat protein